MRREFGWPLAELGNIRLRRGDLAGAEPYVAAHEHAWSPFPGLALLRLEQGDVDSASTFITDAVGASVQHSLEGTAPVRRPAPGPAARCPSRDRRPRGRCRHGSPGGRIAVVVHRRLVLEPFPSCMRCARDRPGSADQGRPRTGDRWVRRGHRRMGRHRCPVRDSPGMHGARRRPSPIGQHRWGTNGVAGSPRSIRGLRCVALGRTKQNISSPEHLPSRPPSPSRVATATFKCDGDTRTICFGEPTILYA